MAELATAGAPAAPGHQPHNERSTIAFVDARYLHRSACQALSKPVRQTQLEAREVRDLLRRQCQSAGHGGCERVYWYEAAFPASDRRAVAQQRYLNWLGDLDLVVHP